MEHSNRPQGRKTDPTGEATDIHRRGEGLNTGPVGSDSRPAAEPPQYAAQANEPARRSAPDAGSRSPLFALAVLLLLLLFGGRELFSGGVPVASVTEEPVSSYTVIYTPRPSPSSYYDAHTQDSNAPEGAGFNSSSPFDSLLPDNGGTGENGGSGENGGTGDIGAPVSVSPSPEPAGPELRDRYTVIYGDGSDRVTVMVYLCGTDLESRGGMATKDLLEMTSARFGEQVRVLAYTGGCSRWNNNTISAKVNQIYEVSPGGLRCLVSDAGTAAMTEPDTLAGFIRFCTANYPANRQALIFWDHGSGSVGGYGYDEKYPRGSAMSLPGIRSALEQSGARFDFIGFDACLMGTMEMALMLEPYADYLIASEETEPGAGWYYTNWLTELGTDPGLATLEVGMRIVDDFVDTCARECRGQSATLSVVDLAELAATTREPLQRFSGSLSAAINGGQYSAISTARNGSREFARSSVIDQIDLVDFAERVGSAEGQALSQALRGAIKYNRVSSDMSRAFGLSIYFPYRKLSNVDKAVSTYSAIGMEESYTQCIRDFAGLETGGQLASGGTHSPYAALVGGGYSVSSYGADMIGSLLEGLLGGSLYGLDSSNSAYFYSRSMSDDSTVHYLAANRFDPDKLVWQRRANGTRVIHLSEAQWALVEDLDLNLFYDDGEGYIDLGLDNVFDFDANGDLLLPTAPSWLAVDGQIVAYYHDTSAGAGETLVLTGHIPVLLNGERAELLVLFNADNPDGVITGARRVYLNGETETVAKSELALAEGDVIDFVCDYYRYDGSYENSYLLGEQYTVAGTPTLSNLTVKGASLSVCYRFADLYQQHYWTPAVVLG